MRFSISYENGPSEFSISLTSPDTDAATLLNAIDTFIATIIVDGTPPAVEYEDDQVPDIMP